MQVQVFETNINHASDIVHWLDATTGNSGSEADMKLITRVMKVELSRDETFLNSKPDDLQLIHKPGAMCLVLRDNRLEVKGESNESHRTRPEPSTYPLKGIVYDSDDKYNPRVFELTLGLGNGHTISLYPSPQGTRLGMGGGVIGNIRFDNDTPAAWALVELEVEVAPSTDINFVAQADANGDFILSMSRLPPLPENEDDYEAKLTIYATTGVTKDTPVVPTGQAQMDIEELDENEYEDELEINVVPGTIHNLKSFNRGYLAVRTSD